ncbi:MAG: LD-carboxypeptidase [Bacteroidia bacterium]
MTNPSYLQKGDTIGIVAPARKISESELKLAITTFELWGLKVKLGKNIFRICNQFSGTDEERANDFQEMLNDVSVKAIICARGGYGTLRIIDSLDFKSFQKNPKWIIGYSDVTVLHSHIHTNFNCQTLHATMPINFSQDAESLETLRKSLFGEKNSYTFESHPLNRMGNAEGILTGGNLSLLYALTGSVSDINTENKILFIEDLDEYLYHIDRMMLNLKRSGKLKNLAALIVGGMSGMKDNLIPFGKTAEEIIFDTVKEYDYPICFGFPAGHITKNFTLPLGTKVRLNVLKKIDLFF